MKTMGGSYHNLAALAESKRALPAPQRCHLTAPAVAAGEGAGGREHMSWLWLWRSDAGGCIVMRCKLDLKTTNGTMALLNPSRALIRLIIVSNILPIRAKKGADGWDWEWDEDALVAQAKVSVPLPRPMAQHR